MSEIGKRIRMERIMDRATKRMVIIPMDHGTTMGPIRGLGDMREIINQVAEGGANAVLLHKGIIRAGFRGYGRDIGLIMHLSASTTLGPDPDDKVLVAEVDESIKLGADAVSIQINVGSDTEPEQLKILGYTAKTCDDWGIPLLAMMYPRGKKIKDQFDVEFVKHVARIGAELGADIVKTNYTGNPESFKEVVKGCPVPVVMAGGPKTETDEEFCRMVYDSIQAGGAGVAAGRNVFQHKNPMAMVKAISAIVYKGAKVDDALKIIGGR
ncbi:MAG: 2-amino-3,7-dideoxy-D-threo-hept-6-ulosonate synthase [Candidatus Bathyarchaeota archaeon]